MEMTERLNGYPDTNEFAILHGVAALDNQAKVATEGRTCFAFSEKEDDAFATVHGQVVHLFAEHGVSPDQYEITQDAIGNLYVTWFGKNRGETFVSGSHLDSVLGGGVFDGPAGVNSAYNFLRHLVENNITPEAGFTMVAWRAEESSPTTGTTSVGSRVATQTMSLKELERVPYKFPGAEAITLKQHIIDTRGEEAWEQIVQEYQNGNPFFSKMRVTGSNELHIEQSAVTERQGRDVGIVVGGIGSAIRQQLTQSVDCNKLTVTPENPHKKITLTFIGEQAHTGGTPPNVAETVDEARRQGLPWYRKDALVASAQFTKMLLSRYGDKIKVLSYRPERATGYTTVPHSQILEFSFPAEFDTSSILAMVQNAERDYGVQVQQGSVCQLPDGEHNFIDVVKLHQQVALPIEVERLVRTAVNNETETDESNSVGTLRATVVDFTFAPNKEGQCVLSANLDLRDVNPEGMRALEVEIGRVVDEISQNVGAPLEQKDVSRKPHAPINEGLARELIATCDHLGVTYATLPSMPGHDGSALAAMGTPICMVFCRHDGISHNPAENLDVEYYRVAEKVQHAFMRRRIGVSN
ncbi:M20/M25/M40 family metallo-hydrolase [Candidatus Gracilibacteria bacterium]|nr:M20/M25/M40 family metallo-hydrolase [Candidatus Gracilibacteria bacterium]